MSKQDQSGQPASLEKVADPIAIPVPPKTERIKWTQKMLDEASRFCGYPYDPEEHVRNKGWQQNREYQFSRSSHEDEDQVDPADAQ